ncbi:alpha/beta hydrolase [Ancylomarina sp. YFZ004]
MNKFTIRHCILITANICIFIVILLSSKTNYATNYLPKPKGIYAIGTTDFFFTDSSRYDNNGFFKKHPRRLYAKVWYPAAGKLINSSPEKYFNKYNAESLFKTYKSIGLSKQLIDSITKSNTNSFLNVPTSVEKEKFPVLVFSSGYYFGIPDIYTHIMESLASHGYIVISTMHPFEQGLVVMENGEVLKLRKKYALLAFLQLYIAEKTEFRDIENKSKEDKIIKRYLHRLKRFNKALDLWTKDTEFCIKSLITDATKANSHWLLKKMDFGNMGIFGHSFGGAVAGNCCQQTNLFKAGANLDCFQFGDLYFDKLRKPFLLIQTEQYPLWMFGNKEIYKKSTSSFFELTLKKTKHFALSDAILLPFDKATQIEKFGSCDLTIVSQYVNDYLIGFFDFYLKNEDSKILFKKIDNANIIFKHNVR